MTFVRPQHSRTKVNQAGAMLANPDAYSQTDYERAREILTNWRAAHAYLINADQGVRTLESRNKGGMFGV